MTQNRVVAIVLLACLGAGVLPILAGPPEQVAFETAYLHDPIMEMHHLEIRGELNGNFELRADPNTCVLDEFGEPAVCTLVNSGGYGGTLRELGAGVQTSASFRLFDMVGFTPSSGIRLRLAVARRPGKASRLLVLDERDAVVRVVSLEPL